MTRKKKVKTRNTKPDGKSKYALKVARRKKLAQHLGFPSNTPYPILLADLAD